MPSILEIFNIPKNYTLEQLKSSYIKILENLYKSNKSNIEKDLLADQYKRLYKQAKQMYMNRTIFNTNIEANILDQNHPYKFGRSNGIIKLNNLFDELISSNISNTNTNTNTNNPNSSQTYSYLSTNSYSSKTNSDGSKTIIESNVESKNGNKKSTFNGYKKLPNGTIIPLTKDELKQIKNL